MQATGAGMCADREFQTQIIRHTGNVADIGSQLIDWHGHILDQIDWLELAALTHH